MASVTRSQPEAPRERPEAGGAGRPSRAGARAGRRASGWSSTRERRHRRGILASALAVACQAAAGGLRTMTAVMQRFFGYWFTYAGTGPA